MANLLCPASATTGEVQFAFDASGQPAGIQGPNGTIIPLNGGGGGGSTPENFTPIGTGAVTRTQTAKLLESVSVLDYGADATGATDSTTAFNNAQNAAQEVRIPAGTYLLNNLRIKNGKRFVGEGYKKSILKQASAAAYAVNCLSDVSTGQIIGSALVNVGVAGATSPTVAAVNIEAVAPYVVHKCEFDYDAQNTFAALRMVNGTANELYGNKVKVTSNYTVGTAFTTAGCYNVYDFFAEQCGNGVALADTTLQGIFLRVVADGALKFSGQNCTINSPTVEKITGTAQYSALRFDGTGHVVISPVVQDVSPAMVSAGGYAMSVYNTNTIINPRVWGTEKPDYPFDIPADATPAIIGGNVLCTWKVEQYLPAATLANVELVGDVSSFSRRLTGKRTNAPNIITAATYTVDANVAASGLDEIIIFNTTATHTLTLPPAAANKGRKLRLTNRAAFAVNSSVGNVWQLNGAASAALLPATAGKWCEIVCDGVDWHMVGAN
jgi:hypothetical protein